MRIIAVDDELAALEKIKRVIKQVTDDEVITFNYPEDAIDFVKDNGADVAFLDVRMDTMTGLECAKALKGINPKINIIFATGYSEYMSDAFHLHASGYITKPVEAEDVKKELENLLNPIEEEKAELYVNTFGEFNVLLSGNPIEFDSIKAKEVLAYIIDAAGTALSIEDISNEIFGGDASECKSALKSLQKTLKQNKLGELIIEKRGNLSADVAKIPCDAYEYTLGIPSAINKFKGEYMVGYEWAKVSIEKFYL